MPVAETPPATSPSPASIFDVAIDSASADFTSVQQDSAHDGFIVALSAACAPMAGLLPSFMLDQQSAMQEAAYRSAFPAAMRRIVLHRWRPVGRIIVDWTPADYNLGVDIAVLPDARATGVGLAMLRAWLTAADTLGKPTHLSVRRDNPAARIYTRLGFRPTGTDAIDAPVITMIRARM